jgi:hypothetical protein
VDYPVGTNRWRTRAILFALVAAVELVVLAAVGAATLAPAFMGGVEEAARDHQLAPQKPRVNPAATERPMLAPAETSVIVLNGNGIAGAAAGTGRRVKGLNYVLSGVGNAPSSDYRQSMVMYRKGFDREAKALAKATGIKLVGPIDGIRTQDLMGAHIALVVGR